MSIMSLTFSSATPQAEQILRHYLRRQVHYVSTIYDIDCLMLCHRQYDVLRYQSHKYVNTGN